MSKDDELAILRETAAKLGRNSYIGPWLEQELPSLEADLRSDFYPLCSRASAQRDCEHLLSVARDSAAQLLRNAQAEAEKIRERARSEACFTRSRILREIDKCRETLGVIA